MIIKIAQLLYRCRAAWQYQLLLRRRGWREIEDIPTHLTTAEKLQIYELASGQGGVALEVGSYLGASACLIAMALLDRKDASHLYCVDTWQNDAMSEGARDTFKLFERHVAPFRRVITPLRGHSVNVAGQFTEKIDFLFIDGNHDYAAVRSDISAWFPLLAPGALVVFHDNAWAPGVQKAVSEIDAPRAGKDGRLPNLYWAWMAR